MSGELDNTSCGCDPRGCRPVGDGLRRRAFLQASGAAALAAAAGPVMAGPFASDNEYLSVIPTDKRLNAEWVRGLFERGEKETYTDPAALRHIGMPVGGLFAGTLYLGGDGRLWLWDIFNRDQEGIQPRVVDYQGQQVVTRNGANYIEPAKPLAPLKQQFVLQVAGEQRPLDATGFARVTFDGRYPLGRVSYQDPTLPVEVTLEAFSPFIPLELADSSLPATVMSFRVCNTSDATQEIRLTGVLENAVCLHSQHLLVGRRRNEVVRNERLTATVCSAQPPRDAGPAPRADILFDDFEQADYEGWTVEGEAFGDGPVEMSKIPAYQGDVAGKGNRVVNSHASAPGNSVRDKDSRTGKLTSRPFTVSRRFIHMLVGGGAHQGKTCVNLLVDDRVVASVTGRSNNRMQPASFSVARHEGQQARLEIVDAGTQGWGNVGVDHIVFSDRPPVAGKLEEQADFGTMALVLLDPAADDMASASDTERAATAEGGLDESLVGRIGRVLRIPAGETAAVDFLVTWHFPNLRCRGVGNELVGNHYATRFGSALAVADYVARDFQRLAGDTRKWVDTWYDSTLPYWLLDRTLANTSTLATTTCYRFRDGRFWAWEGIGCCAGTCTHVWHYAQAPARLFPELERLERSRVNFGIGFHADGGIGMRTGLERANEPAIDGQCGRILGVLREHQMSADDRFLKSLWPRVKQAIAYLIQHDANADGVLEGSQPNTLDAAWYGKISFLSSLYLAALRAGEVMAREMGDDPFAERCRAIADKGATAILETFNGEYFVQIEDPQHQQAIGTGDGCYIDQVFGQSWAHWVDLGRLFDRDKQLSALRALWKYNFVPDVGPFRERFERGRWYALAGDAGLLMCTWPKKQVDESKKKHWQYMYFNECMSGFEWQAAAHMIWEGRDQPDLLQNGLAVARAIYDRYHAALRNPYNEIECSDHYSRAMASYGVFQAACGFHCCGPRGHIAFAPRLTPDRFRSAFTAAEGWGSFSQERVDGAMRAVIELKHGTMRVRSVGLVPADDAEHRVEARLDGTALDARLSREKDHVVVTLSEAVRLAAGQKLELLLTGRTES